MRLSALISRRSSVPAASLACALGYLGLSVLANCSSGGSTGPRAYRDRSPGSLFGVDTTLSVGRSPWALAVADFNGNGATDLAVANLRDRSVSFLFNSPGGGIFHKDTKTAGADTAIVFGPGFRPRAMVASDVDGNGLPDLVILLAQDSLEVGLDRIVVLLNRGTNGTQPERPTYEVGYDELVGRGLYDLFVGGLDETKGSVQVVAAPASTGSGPVVLTRLTRRGDIVDGTINLAGNTPANGATDVGLRDPIALWFDAANVDTAKFARALRDSHWVSVTGVDDDGPPRTIATTLRTKSVPIQNIIQYILTPVHPFKPRETITVAVSADLNVRVPLPRVPGQQGAPDSTTLRLPELKVWTFDVEGLRVIGSNPEDRATGVALDAPVRVQFNYWLAPTSVDGAFRLVGRSREIPVEIAYDPDSTVVRLEPNQGFAPYEDVQVVVAESLLDSTGRATFAGDTLLFQATGPLVLSTVPTSGAVALFDGSPAAQRIVLRFNTPMSSPDATDLVAIGSQSGKHEVGQIEVLEEGREFRVPLLGTFIPGEWTTAIATDGFTSADGGYPLAKPYVWRFAVRPQASPSFALVDPGTGDGLRGGTVAGGRFSVDDARSVVLADTSGIVGLLATGAGPWVRAATVTGVPGRQVVRAGDLDADGLLDLVIARTDSNYVVVLLNTSGASSVVTFGNPARYEVGEHPVGLFIGDLDGDGWLDIVTANVSTNDISVLANNGDGTFGRETFYVVGDHPQAVEGADLDGDGDLDLIVANSSGNTVSLLRNLTSLRESPGARPKLR